MAAGGTAQSVRALVHPPLHIDNVVYMRGNSAEPTYCRITGFIDRGTRIGIELALPEAWNKKVLFLGRGGFAGAVERPTIPSDLPVAYGAARGYATGTTDTGHQSAAVEDATWATDSAAVINHFEVGVELAANALKAIAAAYYAEVPRYAYFQGCSGGGRQGSLKQSVFRIRLMASSSVRLPGTIRTFSSTLRSERNGYFSSRTPGFRLRLCARLIAW